MSAARLHVDAGRTPKLARPAHLILDYDGTLTVKDTMALYAKLGKQSKVSWQELVDAYMKDYQIYKETRFQWQAYNREEYSKWLAARQWVESNSAQRAEAAGFFRGVTMHDLHRAVATGLADQTLHLRHGWQQLIGLFLPHHEEVSQPFHGSKVSILSVNWSRSAIRRTLWESARSSSHFEAHQLSQFVANIDIHANEIHGLDTAQGSSGHLCSDSGDIRTSEDKLRCLRGVKAEMRDNHFTVYVGDSSTDFDCLCEADLGVWLYDVPEAEYEKAAQAIFEPLKFTPPPLTSLKHPLRDAQMLFYWAPNLECLRQFLSAG